jgi:hypothetical protein
VSPSSFVTKVYPSGRKHSVFLTSRLFPSTTLGGKKNCLKQKPGGGQASAKIIKMGESHIFGFSIVLTVTVCCVCVKRDENDNHALCEEVLWVWCPRQTSRFHDRQVWCVDHGRGLLCGKLSNLSHAKREVEGSSSFRNFTEILSSPCSKLFLFLISKLSWGPRQTSTRQHKTRFRHIPFPNPLISADALCHGCWSTTWPVLEVCG